MLHYPKIPGSSSAPNGRCVAFEKYDGTNLHWDWDRDFGWHSFGTRRDEFNLTQEGIANFCEKHEHLSESAKLFQETLAEELEQIFLANPTYQEYQAIKAFTEFLGPNSFAGLHKADDPKELRLLDIYLEGFGMVGPETFVADFKDLPIARVVYQGKLTGQFLEDVRKGKYDIEEGVVCKGGTGGDDLWMIKVKTYAYLKKLQEAFAHRWEEYWE